MADFHIDPCTSCQAAIIWAITIKARTVPVDAEPVKNGNVALEHRGQNATPLARVLNVAQQFGRTDLRTSHFATCPDRANLRRKSMGRRRA